MFALPTTAVCMGATCGDVLGSTFDSHHIKTKEFPLFPTGSHPSGGSVMTVANMLWLTNPSRNPLADSMRTMGRQHPDSRYGHRFLQWLISPGEAAAATLFLSQCESNQSGSDPAVAI